MQHLKMGRYFNCFALTFVLFTALHSKWMMCSFGEINLPSKQNQVQHQVQHQVCSGDRVRLVEK